MVFERNFSSLIISRLSCRLSIFLENVLEMAFSVNASFLFLWAKRLELNHNRKLVSSNGKEHTGGRYQGSELLRVGRLVVSELNGKIIVFGGN